MKGKNEQRELLERDEENSCGPMTHLKLLHQDFCQRKAEAVFLMCVLLKAHVL